MNTNGKVCSIISKILHILAAYTATSTLQIYSFQHENGEQQMKELETRIKDVQLHSEQKSADERTVQHEIDFFESQFVQVSKHKINIERNIELRKTLRELETTNNQLDDIRNEIRNQFGDSADPYRDLKTIRDNYMKEVKANLTDYILPYIFITEYIVLFFYSSAQKMRGYYKQTRRT